MYALSHDIGYPIELSHNRHCSLRDYIERLGQLQQDIHYFHNFERIGSWDLLIEISNSISSVDLNVYSSFQRRCPAYGNLFHDHGIYGALLFLRLMHELFSNEPNRIRNENGSRIIFDRNLLHRALKRVARAIALHNVDSYENALAISRNSNERIYRLHGDSLVWLLKVADELQEWNKFSRGDRINGQQSLPLSTLSIQFINDHICVSNFPEHKIYQLLTNFQRYYSPREIIQLL